MLLLDLIPEMIHKIVEATIDHSNLDAALHLRLVCKTFDEEILLAICNTRAFEPATERIPYKSSPLLSRYLISRTLDDRFRTELYSKVVGQTVDYILSQSQTSADSITDIRESYTRRLCAATAIECRAWFHIVLNPGTSEHHTKDELELVLAAAAYLGLNDIFRHCLDLGARGAPTHFGETIAIVAGRGDLGMTNLFLKIPFKDCNTGIRGLIGAAANGQTEIMELILRAPSIVESPWWSKRELHARLLAVAAQSGHLKTVQYLVETMAPMIFPSTPFRDRESPYYPYRSVYDAQRTTPHWYNVALHNAASGGQEALVIWALENGSDVNVIRQQKHHEPRHGSVLEVAARNGHENIVRFLVARGARVCGYNKDTKEPRKSSAGKLAFKRVVSEGWVGIMRIFLDHGYAVDEGLDRGQVPLLAAVQRGQMGSLRMLLAKGLVIDVKEGKGKMALELAEQRGHGAIVQMLLSAYTPSNPTD